MIYALEAVGTGFIKFGRASSVGRRLAELECGSPYELNIIAVANWPDHAESTVHRYLEPVSERREWFRDSSLARQVIAWMVNGEAGLERIQQERPQRLKRTLAYQRSLAHAQPPKIQQRRAERAAWWAAIEKQQSTAANGHLTPLKLVSD